MATVNGIKIIKRKANVITNPDDINDIINITEAEACSSSLIMEFFGKLVGPAYYPLIYGRKKDSILMILLLFLQELMALKEIRIQNRSLLL